jgi:membrane-bound lytic murein transglycosylase MltF
MASPKLSYQYLIQKAAQKHAIDPALIQAVIKQESAYNRFAVSNAGAQGLMQLMPATAKRFKVKNAFIPAQNINAGSQYLAWLLKRFNGNVRFALAGYNAGEGKVDRYKGIPPYRETRRYVKKVMRYYRQFKATPSRHYIAKVHSAKLRLSHSSHLIKRPVKKQVINAMAVHQLLQAKLPAKQPAKQPYDDVIQHINHQLSQVKTYRIRSVSLSQNKIAPERYTRFRAAYQRGI